MKQKLSEIQKIFYFKSKHKSTLRQMYFQSLRVLMLVTLQMLNSPSAGNLYSTQPQISN